MLVILCEMGSHLKTLLREAFGKVGSKKAPTSVLVTLSYIRLAGFALIMLPTHSSLQNWLPDAHVPNVAWLTVKTWQVIALSYAIINLLMIALQRLRPDRYHRTIYALTILCMFGEFGTGQVSGYYMGSVLSAAGLTPMLTIAAYRILGDYNLGRIALGISSLLFLGTSLVEAFHILPLAPGLSTPLTHRMYDTTLMIVVQATSNVFYFSLLFGLVNYSVNQTTRLHNYITSTVLARYLPASLVEQVARGEWNAEAKPERRVLTIMFTDMVGFTSLSEKLGPEAIGELLNKYLATLADLAHEHGATIDKFIGDCVMVFFGAPEDMPPEEQARRAVALAQAIQKTVPTLSEDARLAARTGINTGEVVVGNFGSIRRSDYTVLGPAVNLAARLESASQRNRIMIGPKTAALLPDSIVLEARAPLQLKGIAQPVEAFFIQDAMHGESTTPPPTEDSALSS